MTYENIKSVILAILVCASVLLTWSLWTYQPNYEEMGKLNTVQGVAISEKKDVNSVVKPDRIYLYYAKDKTLGTIDNKEIDTVINEFSKWNLSDFKNVSDEIGNFPAFIHNKGNAVILFPDWVPIELYRNFINIRDNKLPDFYFDRIVIDLNDIDKEQGQIYFISSEEKRAYRCHVSAASIQNFKNGYYRNAEFNTNFSKYFPFHVSKERTIYLPVDETKMQSYQYLSNPLESEKFKYALFRDPSFVQKNYKTSIEEYTDGFSLMRVDHDKNTISYVNPIEENENKFSSKTILKRSIDFINEHSGWTDNYRFADIDINNRQVTFRLYDSKGYPVFSDNNAITEISEVWGQNEIKKYLRSNFSLGLRTESTETTLSSGKTVIRQLEKLKGFEKQKLQDVVLGYNMIKDAQTRLVYLEPSWYYRYDNTWLPLDRDKAGGEIIYGLE